MRVGFIHPGAPGGEGTGATHSATRIVRLLRGFDYEVVTYCLAPPSSGTAESQEQRYLDLQGFPFHTGSQLNAKLGERIAEFEEMDVVHSYLPRSLPAMKRIGRETSAATLVTLNGFGAVCPKNDLRFLDREPCRENGRLRCTVCCVATSGGHERHGPIYRSVSRIANLRLVERSSPGDGDVDAFHVLSEHLKRTYRAFGFPAERMHVVPNVLDDRFLVEHRSRFAEPFRLLYVGGLEVHKGVLSLPDIIERLDRGSAPDVRLTVVGAGGLRERLVAEFEARGVADRVSVLGQLPNSELPHVYASHDLFVYPGTLEEPFGRVFLESLAAGTPVVSTDVGAVAEIVGKAGIVTEPTPASLAEEIQQLLEGPRLEACAAACRREVARFSAEAVGPAFRQLYDRALGVS